jgi:Secretion system C-terminal sorting domain/Copper type II ascorbate-dependent monooxygenase, C-terminal domain
MKKALFSILFLSAALITSAQTWNQDIAQIVYDHCGKCHHDGGIAPSSLVSYADASSNAGTILDYVTNGVMPPWPANPNYRHFVDENVLSADQISAIQNWVNNGTPEGTGSAPTVPSYNDGYQISSPDQIVSIPDYTVTSDQDVYRSFLMTNATSTAFNIDQIEFDPDNTDIVHHVLAWYDPSNVPQQSDDADPGPGWTSFGGSFPSDQAKLIGVWVPGMGITDFPSNLAIHVPAGANFVMEVHFAPGSINQTSHVKMRLKYKTGTVRQVFHDPLLYHGAPSLQEPALVIPANTTPTFHEQSVTSTYSLSLLSVFPHMHLLGKRFKVFAVTTAQDTIPVVDADKYEFHWQFSYKFPTLLKLPAGARLYGEATYDNTTNNEENPYNPPQMVTLGENTTDEMMVCFFMYTLYQAGDENMSQAAVSEFVTDAPQRVLAFPNPSTGKVYVDYPNDIKKVSKVQVMDLAGKSVDVQFTNFSGRMELDLSDLPPSVYQVIITGDNRSVSTSVVLEK